MAAKVVHKKHANYVQKLHLPTLQSGPMLLLKRFKTTRYCVFGSEALIQHVEQVDCFKEMKAKGWLDPKALRGSDRVLDVS